MLEIDELRIRDILVSSNRWMTTSDILTELGVNDNVTNHKYMTKIMNSICSRNDDIIKANKKGYRFSGYLNSKDVSELIYEYCYRNQGMVISAARLAQVLGYAATTIRCSTAITRTLHTDFCTIRGPYGGYLVEKDVDYVK